MKIDIHLVGLPAQPAEYAQVRAALVAAQAATPTARATRGGPAAVPPRDALEQLLDGASASGTVASSLDHRFAPGLPAPGDAA